MGKKAQTARRTNAQVEIPIIGGASAGGMTNIMAAAPLQQGIEHFDKPGPDLMAEQPQNILYHSRADLTQEDMISEMLSVGDIKPDTVLSAMNSDFIDVVATRVIFHLGGCQNNIEQVDS